MSIPQTWREQTRGIAQIAVPVSLEFVLTLVLGFVNQVVVGTLGAVPVAAVGLANSVVLILTVTLGALGTAVGILVARAHGAGDRSRLDRVVGVGLVGGGLAGAAAGVLLAGCAGRLLGGVGASAAVADAGAPYLRLMAATVPFTALAAVVSATMRSTGRARSSLHATTSTVVVQAVLGYGLVLGVGPLPRLGVPGAGWAALVTSVLKLVVLLVQAYVVQRLVSLRGRRAGGEPVLTPLVTLAAPLVLTALLWSAGTFLYNVVAAHLGDRALAAAQIATTLESVFFVGSIGLMTAASALVGSSLGARDARGADSWTRAVMRTGLATGVTFGLLYAGSILLLPTLYGHVGADVRRLAAVGILINGAFQAVKVRNLILGGSVLPTASDTRGVIMGDVTGAFAVGLPLAVLLGLFTPLGMAGVFLARIAEELAKLSIFTRRRRRVRWTELV